MGGNGDSGGRKVRRDRPFGRARAEGAGVPGDGGPFWSSGRVFVTAAVVGVLVLWAGLYAAFRVWRQGYQERAGYGARVVAGAVRPFDGLRPEGVDPAAWDDAVNRTRAMLADLIGSNVLDTAAMRALGAEVAARARRARARPSTARAELAAVWDHVEARGGPVVTARHRRPALLRAGDGAGTGAGGKGDKGQGGEGRGTKGPGARRIEGQGDKGRGTRANDR